MRLITIAPLIIATLATAHADDRKRHESKRHESHNYIIERQQAGSVSGVPILRRIRGSREIDIYRDGSMLDRKSTRLNSSPCNLVCRLLLEKKKKKNNDRIAFATNDIMHIDYQSDDR